jgi:hypothetical protein
MVTPQKVHIGILSPATADRPHFKSLEQMLPPEVTVTMKVSACCKIPIMTWKARRTRSLPAPPTLSVETKSGDSSLPAAS